MFPSRAACTAAGSSAARPGLRSESTTTESRSTPDIVSFFIRPFGSRTFPVAGFAASRLATVTTSPAKSGVALRHALAQYAASVAGIARATFALYGSGRSVGRTESSTRRSMLPGCAYAYASASFVP